MQTVSRGFERIKCVYEDLKAKTRGQVQKHMERGLIMREQLKKARQEAGMTQQAMADKLGVTIGYYQKVEYEKLNGSFAVWDALEDILGIHQRILRESSNTHHVQVKNQQEH